MKRNFSTALILLSAILGAVSLMGLRYYQLFFCTDENGLLLHGSPVAWGFVALIVVVIAALLLLIVPLRGSDASDHCAGFGIVGHLLSAAAAVLLLVGCACRSLECSQGNSANLLLYSAGVLSGAMLIVNEALLLWGKRSNFLLVLLPCIFLVAKLIFDYKNWSTIPTVIDFCFMLFASVTAMLACFNRSGFLLGIGRLRTTVFFCMLSFVFSAMTVADFLYQTLPVGEFLIFIALGLWCLFNGLLLLPGSQKTEHLRTTQNSYEEENNDTLL